MSSYKVIEFESTNPTEAGVPQWNMKLVFYDAGGAKLEEGWYLVAGSSDDEVHQAIVAIADKLTAAKAVQATTLSFDPGDEYVASGPKPLKK